MIQNLAFDKNSHIDLLLAAIHMSHLSPTQKNIHTKRPTWVFHMNTRATTYQIHHIKLQAHHKYMIQNFAFDKNSHIDLLLAAIHMSHLSPTQKSIHTKRPTWVFHMNTRAITYQIHHIKLQAHHKYMIQDFAFDKNLR